MQIGAAFGSCQHGVDQFVGEAADVGLHPLDDAGRETLLDETAVHRMVGRVAEETPADAEARRLPVVTGPGRPVAQHRRNVAVAGHRQERRVEVIEPVHRALRTHRRVRRERIRQHISPERVVVDLSHAANVPNGSAYDRCVDLAACLADTDALIALDAAHAAAWIATDATLLAICRDRVGMLLRHGPTLDAMSAEDRNALGTWTTSDRFSARERCALAFTEQYVIDVASLTDIQATELRGHLGDDGLVSFVNALLVIEQRMTLELAFDGVL